MASPVIDFHIHVRHVRHVDPSMVESIARAAAIARRCGRDCRLSERVDGMLAANGVDYAVVLAETSPLVTGIVPNEYVIDFCRRSRRLLPFVCLNPHMAPSPAKELARLVRDRGARGLKLYPTYQGFYPNDRALYPVYSMAQELASGDVHTGSSVFKGSRLKYGNRSTSDDIAVDFPALTILMAHSGRPSGTIPRRCWRGCTRTCTSRSRVFPFASC